MENSENRDLTMAGVTDQNTFFEPQKARNPSKYWGFWCRKWDSNPHGVLAQRILSRTHLRAVDGKKEHSEVIKGYQNPR